MVRSKRQAAKRNVVAAGSWMALLAATTLGGETADTVSALVKVATPLDGGQSYRLVVQSYDETEGELPTAGVRPVGSMQRPVTAEELRDGVHVSLLELRMQAPEEVSRSFKPVVVAWLEPTDADLEFDGRRARPQPDDVYGVVPRPANSKAGGPLRISLKARKALLAA